MTRLFVEQLTVIDCAVLDAVRGLVGQSWIADLELSGALDAQSMLFDFGEVKRRIKQAIDTHVDHKLLVPLGAPGLRIARGSGRLHLQFDSAVGRIEHASPEVAVSLIDAPELSPDALIAHLLPALRAVVPGNVSGVHLALREEAIAGAHYHYVHGLKKHAGECQRIAHGHRSKLEIRLNGQRNAEAEAACAARWRDIYLGTREDRAPAPGGRMRFEYTAAEGAFMLELPAARCDLLDTDSTVERIAEHLAARLAAERPGVAIEVRAYEGVGKGAVARAGG